MNTLAGTILACCLALCGHARADTLAAAHADFALAVAREDEKLADDVERALAERWPSVADILGNDVYPRISVEDIMHSRGLPDAEAGLAEGVFSNAHARRRYFAALLLGWNSEPAALKIAARVEARRLASLSAASAELPDVEQRLALDRQARAASDRLHALCQRLVGLGVSCSDAVLGQSSSELSFARVPES